MKFTTEVVLVPWLGTFIPCINHHLFSDKIKIIKYKTEDCHDERKNNGPFLYSH